MTIEQAKNKLYATLKQYPEINGCGLGRYDIQVYIENDPNDIIKTLPKTYEGYKVTYIKIRKIHIQ